MTNPSADFDMWSDEVQELYDDLRTVCSGHQHDQVMCAIGKLLVDALDPRFFPDKMSLNKRIDTTMEVMKEMIRLMNRENLQ